MTTGVASTLLALEDVRAAAAAALEDAAGPNVLMDVVDAVEPPALILLWDDPWLELETSRQYVARLLILAVAGRIEPGPGIATLEGLVAYVVGRLRADAYAWPHAAATAPRVFDIGGVPYLGARVSYAVRVSIGGP